MVYLPSNDRNQMNGSCTANFDPNTDEAVLRMHWLNNDLETDTLGGSFWLTFVFRPVNEIFFFQNKKFQSLILSDLLA